MRPNGDKPANRLTATDRLNATDRLGERHTVAEAAELLGTTTDAIRGRIRRGTLNSIKVDGQLYVLLDPVSRDRHADRPRQSDDQPRQSPDTSELVEELRDQIEWLRR